MNTKLYTLSLFSIFLLASCNKEKPSFDEIINSDDREKIQTLKEELYHDQRDLLVKIEKLDKKLASFDDESKYRLVEAILVNESTFKHFIKIQGNVTTDENIIIYPEFTGVLTEVFVKEGDIVKKGQRLARIDDRGLKNQLAEMKSQQALAKTVFERQERLWEQNIGSEIQYLEAKTSFEQINNGVLQMQQQLDKASIVAPFDGVIDNVLTDKGQVVAQNQNAIFRLVNLRNMYLEANVPETYVGQIEQGSEAEVRLRALGIKLQKPIDRVSSFIEDSNRNFRVRVNLPDTIPNLKPNLIATLRINDYTNENAIVINESVLQETASGEFFVHVLQQEKGNSSATSEYRKVTPGRSYQGEVEILEGLKANELIATEGARSLKRGEKVRIANPENTK